jgi:hypothetical protein
VKENLFPLIVFKLEHSPQSHHHIQRTSQKETLLKLELNLRENPVKCYIWSIALYDEESWTLRKAEQKYKESFKIW